MDVQISEDIPKTTEIFHNIVFISTEKQNTTERMKNEECIIVALNTDDEFRYAIKLVP